MNHRHTIHNILLFSDVYDVITWQRVCKAWKHEILEQVLARFLTPSMALLARTNLDRGRMLLDSLKNAPLNLNDPRCEVQFRMELENGPHVTFDVSNGYRRAYIEANLSDDTLVTIKQTKFEGKLFIALKRQ